jgi:putative ABC transport system permease protein
MGVGMLLGIVLIMIGVYRGMIVDAKVLLDDLSVDLWVVQEDTLGPFAESSRVHEDLKDSVYVIDGVDKTAGLTFQNLQLPTSKKPVRVVAVGFNPFGSFDPINPNRILHGRGLERDHYEIVVSDNIGFKMGEEISIGRNTAVSFYIKKYDKIHLWNNIT